MSRTRLEFFFFLLSKYIVCFNAIEPLRMTKSKHTSSGDHENDISRCKKYEGGEKMAQRYKGYQEHNL